MSLRALSTSSSPQAASGAASAASVKATAILRESGTRGAYPRGRSRARGRRPLACRLVGRMVSDPLVSFTPEVRDWFMRSFERPTEAQAQAWPAIAAGDNVLLSAPTGSGKTLAAFLWALDRLAARPLPDGERKTRLVYVSPLKALSYDVEKNLRAPLRGIGG